MTPDSSSSGAIVRMDSTKTDHFMRNGDLAGLNETHQHPSLEEER